MTTGNDSLLQSTEAKLIQLSLDHIRESQSAQAESLRRLGASLESLVKLEQAQGQILEKLRDGSERMNKLDMRITDNQHDLSNRVASLERDMPSLIELRKWVIGGMLAGIGMMGVALFKMVLVDPMQAVSRTTAETVNKADLVALQQQVAQLIARLTVSPVAPPTK